MVKKKVGSKGGAKGVSTKVATKEAAAAAPAVSKAEERKAGGVLSFSVHRTEQNGHGIYHTSIPIEVLMRVCAVSRRDEDPEKGFQRHLDEKRAVEIGAYIDAGGIILGNISLAAQSKAKLEYNRKNRTLAFKDVPGAFFIIDGQHRTFGFSKAAKKLSVAVAICEGLSDAQQAEIFSTTNTKAQKVPASLLLDIKSLAEVESAREAILRGLFDKLSTDEKSPLHGLLSATGADKTKLSRVGFNRAVSPLLNEHTGALRQLNAEMRYGTLRRYLQAVADVLPNREALIKPSVFPAVCEVFGVTTTVALRKYAGGVAMLTETLREVVRPAVAILITGSRDGNGRKVPRKIVVEMVRAAIDPPAVLNNESVVETESDEIDDEAEDGVVEMREHHSKPPEPVRRVEPSGSTEFDHSDPF